MGFFHVLFHNSLIFHRISKVKKRKFAENSPLSFTNDQKVLAPLVKQLEQLKGAKLRFLMFFLQISCHNSFVFHQILKDKKRKFAENSPLSFTY